LLTELFEK